MQKGNAARPALGEGVHDVKVKEVNLEFDVETYYGPKDLFQIRYQSDRGKTITQKYIAYYDESSEFGKVVLAVLGELPEDFDTDLLIGKQCKITVESKVSKKNKTFYNVVKVEASDQPSDQEKASQLFNELDI